VTWKTTANKKNIQVGMTVGHEYSGVIAKCGPGAAEKVDRLKKHLITHVPGPLKTPRFCPFFN